MEVALKGMREQGGGPFGAVVVKDQIIIGKGHNSVTATNDPTARLESVGWAGDIKRRIVLILRNRTGRPAILERREEVVQ